MREIPALPRPASLQLPLPSARNEKTGPTLPTETGYISNVLESYKTTIMSLPS